MSEWNIIKGANDILICGPGNLIISLREFERKKVEIIDKDIMGKATVVSRVRYPLDSKTSLELTLFSSGSHTQIKLHVGDRIQWTIPEDFSKSLWSILTAAPVYSQPTGKKSTTKVAKTPKASKTATAPKAPIAKAKRTGPAKPKHQKISGRALERQKIKAELGLKADKPQRIKRKTKSSALEAASSATPNLKAKVPKVAKPQSITAKAKPGRPPKAKPVVPDLSTVHEVKPKAKRGRPPKKSPQVPKAVLVNNVVMPKAKLERPLKAAKPKAATEKKATRPGKVSKAKPKSKPKTER